jgi:hypothetical protein
MLICRDRFVMPAAFAERQSCTRLYFTHFTVYGAPFYTRVLRNPTAARFIYGSWDYTTKSAARTLQVRSLPHYPQAYLRASISWRGNTYS